MSFTYLPGAAAARPKTPKPSPAINSGKKLSTGLAGPKATGKGVEPSGRNKAKK